jgi:hypothetical protein
MFSGRTVLFTLVMVLSVVVSGVGHAQQATPTVTPTPVPVYDNFQDCIKSLKTKGGSNPKTIAECGDSSKDPTWIGAPAYMCTFDYVEGDLRGVDPTLQYHEQRHVATSWLCERLTYKNGTRKWALYKNLETESVFAVTRGTRIYAGKKMPVAALWTVSDNQDFYVLCPSSMQVLKEHHNGLSGGTVQWTAPRPGATEHEPRLTFPKKHTNVSYAYFDPVTEKQKNKGERPCKPANPFLGQGQSFQQNAPHNPEAPEDPKADDNIFDLGPQWRPPPGAPKF